MKKNKGLLITFIILTILVAAVAIVAALCTLFNPPLLTLPLPFEIPVIAVYGAAGLAVALIIATILIGALSGKQKTKKKKASKKKKVEEEPEVEEVDEIVEKASNEEEEVVEEVSEEIEEGSADEIVEEPEAEAKEEAIEEKAEEPAQEEAQEAAVEEQTEEPQEAQEEGKEEEAEEPQEEEQAPVEEEKEQIVAEENKKEHAAPAAVEEVVEEKAPVQKAEKTEFVPDERFAEFMAAQIKLNQSMDKRLDGIDKTLKFIADMLKGLMYDAVPVGTTAVTVPIQENDEPLQAEEPAPQVQAQEEEPTTDGGNYFEQVEEDKQIEDKNAQIASDYAEEDDWIATADQELRIKPKMSFEMRLRVADEDIKKFYSDIKNELLSYGVHDRISRHRENFNQGRINICRMVINGKTLKVYLAVDPESIDKRYFHHTDVGHRKGLVELPTMINVRSKVSARKVKELITLMMEILVISKKEYTPEDFAAQLTVDGYTTVECKGYDYLVQKSVTLDSVKEYPDNFAAQLIEMVEDNEYQERFIKTNLSIDDLAKNFKSGDVIDIDKVRELGLGPANSNFLSITEGKKLDKKFKVYANEFTPNAVKMICLSGGEAFLVVQPEQTIEEV